MDGACFGIVGAVHQAADAGMNQRARAHGARLNCSKQLAVAQTVVTDVDTGVTQGDDLGMGGGIVVREIAIPSATDDLVFTDYNRAYRHFSHLQCSLGAAEGLFHPEFVVGNQLSAAGGQLPENSSQFSVPSSQSRRYGSAQN